MNISEPKATSIRQQIIQGTAGGFVIQIGFAGLSFIIATLLARLLSLDAYGAYTNAIAWVNILSVLGLFGFNSLLLRDVAILKAQEKWALMKGLLQFSDRLVLIVSFFLMLILWGTARFLFSAPEKESLRFSLSIAAPLIPLWTLIYLRQAALRGLQQVTYAMLPDLIIRPGLTLVSILGVNLFLPDLFNYQSVIVLSIVISMIALAISISWLHSFLPEGFYQLQSQYHIVDWLRAAPPMFVIGCAQIINAQAPIIMLGLLSNAKNISYFAVASRLSNLLIFLPMALGIVMGPMIARLYSQGETARLQKVLKKTNRLIFAVTLLFSLILFIFAKNILSIFGQEYQVAEKAFILLTLGYLVDTGFGMSIITLMMTGYEQIVANYQLAFAVLLVVLCVILIPAYGYESAAQAFMLVMLISRFTFAFLAKRKTGINTTIF